MDVSRAAIYARYSSDRQDDATIETQVGECSRKAESLGLIVVAHYIEKAQSAKTDERPEFQRLLREAKGKPRPWDVLIVRKFDRFARNLVHARLEKEMLARLGIRVISVHEDIDSSTPTGWMMENIIDLFSEWYSRNLASEVRSGMETNTKRGYRNGGTPPFGYRNVKVLDEATGKTRTKLEPDEREAEIVRLVFQRYTEGLGFNRIIAELVEKGMKPRRAKTWSKSAISQMLSNETYNGVLFWRKSKTERVRNEGGVPRLVSKSTWAKTAKRLAVNRDSRNTKASGSTHPFTGIMFCMLCGARFVTASKPRGKWKLMCATRKAKRNCENGRYLDEETMVDKVKKVLIERVYTREKILEALELLKTELSKEGGEQEKKLAELNRRIEENTSAQVRLTEDMALGKIPIDVVSRTLEKMESDRKNLQERAQKLSEDVMRAQKLRVSGEEVELWCQLARDKIASAKGDSLRRELLRFGVVIRIGKRDGEITVNPTLSSGVTTSLSAGGPVVNDIVSFVTRFRVPTWGVSGLQQYK